MTDQQEPSTNLLLIMLLIRLTLIPIQAPTRSGLLSMITIETSTLVLLKPIPRSQVSQKSGLCQIRQGRIKSYICLRLLLLLMRGYRNTINNRTVSKSIPISTRNNSTKFIKLLLRLLTTEIGSLLERIRILPLLNEAEVVGARTSRESWENVGKLWRFYCDLFGDMS